MPGRLDRRNPHGAGRVTIEARLSNDTKRGQPRSSGTGPVDRRTLDLTGINRMNARAPDPVPTSIHRERFLIHERRREVDAGPPR